MGFRDPHAPGDHTHSEASPAEMLVRIDAQAKTIATLRREVLEQDREIARLRIRLAVPVPVVSEEFGSRRLRRELATVRLQLAAALRAVDGAVELVALAARGRNDR